MRDVCLFDDLHPGAAFVIQSHLSLSEDGGPYRMAIGKSIRLEGAAAFQLSLELSNKILDREFNRFMAPGVTGGMGYSGKRALEEREALAVLLPFMGSVNFCRLSKATWSLGRRN